MQEVMLKGPRVINGAVRYPVEGLIPVSDDEYDRLVEDKAIVTDEDLAVEDPDGLDELKIAQLKTLAGEESIDLGTATRQADIIAAIRAHRAANPS